MFTDTVTVFNRLHKSDMDWWYPTVLTGVELQVDRSAMVSKYGAQTADRAALHIKWKPGAGGSIVVGGKEFLTAKAWQQRGEPHKTITFAAGEAFDVFMAGAWNGIDIIKDTDYSRGFYDWLNKTRDGVYSISSVSFFKVVPHFEVTGK